jgi:hypothetical protein
MSTVEVPINPLTEDAQRELVRRVMNSREFATSPTLRAFLFYVADHAIAGRLEAIKEQQIGCHVLGRKPDYDPAEDNIVRVRARQVRQKLENYFRGDGHHEPVVISIPKGHYVPIFQPRTLAGERIASSSDAKFGNDDAAIQLSPLRERSGYWKFASWAVAVIAVLASSVVVWFNRTDSIRRAAESDDAGTARLVWESVLPNRNQQLTVVTADAGFALWQDITHQELNLGDYLSRKYLEDKSGSPDMREIAARRYTSPADLSVSLRLAEIAKGLGCQMKVQFARSVDIHDVKAGSLVLLGSRRSNPWIELFEPSMNFVLAYRTGAGGPGFLNRSPKPGEPKYFSMPSTLEVHGAEDKAVDSYALAALVPNPSGRGMAMIVEGLSMEGTEAAGELITNMDRFGALLRQIGVKKNGPIEPFEVLLKLTAVAGGYGQSELCAYRYPGATSH